MALTANALTTVARLRSYLSRSRTAATDGELGTDRLEDLINAASAHIETYCDRHLICPATAQTYTLDHDGGSLLVLPEWPIVAITSITDLWDNVAIAARTAPYGDGYYAHSEDGRIDLYGYAPAAGEGVIQVVARLGYDATTAALTTPIARRHARALAELEQACWMLCYHWWSNPNPGAEAVTIDQMAMTIRPEPMPRPVAQLLAGYRRPPVW